MKDRRRETERERERERGREREIETETEGGREKERERWGGRYITLKFPVVLCVSNDVENQPFVSAIPRMLKSNFRSFELDTKI